MGVFRQVRWAVLAAVAAAAVLAVIVMLPVAETVPDTVPRETGSGAERAVPEIRRPAAMPSVQRIAPSRPAPLRDVKATGAPAALSPLDGRQAGKPVDLRPMIAIVIDDMAYNRTRFDAANNLPAEISFAFLPDVENVADMASAAAARGHDLLVHLPMEPVGPVANPGPGALMVDGGRAQWENRLQQALASFDGYIGVNNHMGSRATADPVMMKWLMSALKSRGLAFLDSKTTARSVAEKAARHAGIRTASRQIFLDPDGEGAVAAQQFQAALRIARKHGSVIVICHPYAQTLSFLAATINTGDPRYRLVPISRVLN